MSRRPNSFFQFKQFRVDQADVAMKVTTEGCILGAYVDEKLQDIHRVLDIGTGTGLLSLMVAQKFPNAFFDALDVDHSAVKQAEANFSNSPWSDRFSINYDRLQEYEPDYDYDLVVCNPPFFHKSQRSPDPKINLARHNESLSPSDLALHIKRLLCPDGKAYVLYPPEISQQFLVHAEKHGLYEDSRLEIFTSINALESFRWISVLSGQRTTSIKKRLFIRSEPQTYTDEFIRLLKPYYLYL